MDREMYLYECTECCLVFGVETAYEDHSQIVCPVCQSDESIDDAGCAMATLTREPERSE
jgi:predicted nucleic acid-binding Zn ribbon protein